VDVLATLTAHPGIAGVALAALLATIALFIVRRQPREARWPFILIAVHVVAELAWAELAPQSFGAKILRFIAVFSLLASVARSGFLIFTGSRLVRRYVRPWPKILRDVVQVLLYFGVAMVALRAVGVEPSSLLTTSALLTAVLGLSMQETLGNLFAGLALQGQQSFAVGDWVRFADGPEGVGEVVEINWRATHFLTNNQVSIIVPNGVIARAVLKNYSRPTPLVRRDIDIVAPYAVAPERMRASILAAIADSRGVLAEPVPTVLVRAFDDRGIVYSVRYFIEDYGDREPVDGGVKQRIVYALRREGIDYPYPRRHVVAPALEHVVEHLAPAGALPRPPSELDERLAELEPFAGLDRDAIEELAKGSRLLLFAPGETIIRQGDPGSELFGVQRGQVEIRVKLRESELVPVGKLGPGAIFGEAALLTGGARTATIVALSECEVLAVSRAAFQKVTQSRPELSEKLTSLLAKRMDQLSQTINDAEADGKLDGDRRSDLLIQRIKSFFGGGQG
jgi:small-conductance mechanosensitive channel/CRP-like cAMP-binding protein